LYLFLLVCTKFALINDQGFLPWCFQLAIRACESSPHRRGTTATFLSPFPSADCSSRVMLPLSPHWTSSEQQQHLSSSGSSPGLLKIFYQSDLCLVGRVAQLRYSFKQLQCMAPQPVSNHSFSRHYMRLDFTQQEVQSATALQSSRLRRKIGETRKREIWGSKEGVNYRFDPMG
jgi:hypothetical protein